MKTHEHFMQLALQEAERAAAAGEFPVGCVLVISGRVVVRASRTHSTAGTANELDHAEVAALRELVRNHPETDVGRVVVYSTMEPCLMCYSALLLNGIRTIVYGYEDVMGGGTNLELSRLAPLYKEMAVTVVPHVLRQECLELFQRFFGQPENTYWQNSPLAEYTLRQRADEPPWQKK